MLLDVFLIFIQRIELGNILREIVIDFRKLLLLDLVYDAFEDSVLAGKFLSLIFFRELDIDVFLFFKLHADQLLFEARNEHARTDCKFLVRSLAAVKRSSVNRAFIIERDDIAVLDRAVIHIDHAGVLILLLLDCLFNFLRIDFDLGLRNFESAVLAELDVRLQRDFRRVNERLAFLNLRDIDFRLGNDFHAALFDSFSVILIDADICRIFIEDARAVHALDHLQRRMAFAESWQGNLVLVFIVGFLNRLIELLCRDFDSQFRHVVL